MSALCAAAAPAYADCKIQEIAEFHTQSHGGSPIIEGSIDGKPIRVLLDSGSMFSLLSRGAADKLGLILDAQHGTRLYTVGGQAPLYMTRIKNVRIGNYTADSMDFAVTGGRDDLGFDLLLGDDFLSQADLEFDLANDVVRILQPQGCEPAQLVYWNKPYSMATEIPWSRDTPTIQTLVQLNGRKVLAELDSGASSSVVDTGIAASVGVTPRSADARPGGTIRGLGPEVEPSFIGKFDSFTFGDEKIGNPRLQVTALEKGFTDTVTNSRIARPIADAPSMLVGADFLASHRVLVANREHLILFSYNGGPIFRLRDASAALDDAVHVHPEDAGVYLDRAIAHQKKGELEQAVQDLDQAIKLKPDNAYAFIQRAVAYDAQGRHDLAILDFDQAARLKPDDQDALNGGCWARAEANTALDLALADCDAALKLSPQAAGTLDSRALVYFQLGQFGRAEADDNAALKLDPKQASSLYLRGVAKRRTGDADGGDADIAMAEAADASIAAHYAKLGIAP